MPTTKKSEATLRLSPDDWLGMLIIDESGRIVAYDGAIEELFEGTVGERLVSAASGEQQPTLADTLLKAARACLETGQPVTFDLQLPRRDGARLIAAIASPLVSTGEARLVAVLLRPGFPRGSVPAVPDLEETHRAATRLAVAEVAHELNRPLAAVLNYAELALHDPDLPDAARARLEMVVQHAEACRQAVARSLRTGAPQSGHLESVDLNQVAQRAAASLAQAIDQQHADVSFDLDPDLPTIAGALQDLEAVVRNLLENAVHAGTHSASGPKVRVTTGAAPSGVRLTVRDNGPGIAPSAADRIFEPFITTKEAGQGTGLGLSIVRRIVTEHGGQVRADAAPGGGALFTVDLPFTTQNALEPTDAVQPLPGAAAASDSGTHRRALLIDDDASMRKLLGAYLGTLGYESMEAGDGREGLREALAEDYDVIICDVRMPSMNGLEFYTSLKEAFPDRADRVIFSTGVLATDGADAFLRSLPNPRLQKPYRLASLRNALAAASAG